MLLVCFFRQILLIGGTNPIEDVEKFKEHGYALDITYYDFNSEGPSFQTFI